MNYRKNLFMDEIENISRKYPYLSQENIFRILILFHGINYHSQTSYPDVYRHFELIFTVQEYSSFSLLTFLNPASPFTLVDGAEGTKVLLYKHAFVGNIFDYEQRLFDFRNQEPFYFYVKEVNGELVLKLNPIQLCRFFVGENQKPCSFCFRADMVKRFRNTTSKELVKFIIDQEEKKDGGVLLHLIDEISIITGTYNNDEEYLHEIVTLVTDLVSYLKKPIRVVVGSHEGKGIHTFRTLKQAGVTCFAFPVECLDDHVRNKDMKNKKGTRSIEHVITDMQAALEIFGDDGIIVRVIAGMGDSLDESFVATVKKICHLSKTSIPLWNVNQYMPFTHYHWEFFKRSRPYNLDYMFQYCTIINTFVPLNRQIRFKVSP